MSNPAIESLVVQASQHAMGGRAEQALPLLQQALTQDPSHVEANRLMGLCLIQVGQAPQAVAFIRRACELSPRNAELWGTLGSTYAVLQRLDEGIAATLKAIELDPNLAQAHGLVATLYLQKSDLESAERHYAAALAIQPRYPEAQTNYGVVMNMTARQDEAMTILRQAARDNPNHLGVLTNYAVATNYADGVSLEEIFRAHVNYGRVLATMPPAMPGVARWPNAREPGKRLRVGFLSMDLCDHSVAYFLLAILEHRDRGSVEYIGYMTGAKNDWMTQRLGRAFDGWRDLSRHPEPALIQQIRADQCDILIELSGHTLGHKLAALRHRAAPVQATYCGYPNTTGTPNIDYRLIDSITDPPGSEQRATETLLRLDPCFLCYTGDETQIAEQDLPAALNGHITFGSFNSIKKITPGVVELWARCLHAVPTARLVIKSGGLAAKVARQRLSTLLKQAGVPEVRFDLIDRLPNKGDHMAAYGAIDIGLDTFPYNGTTTTCEALWMGVPVITLRGTTHASRVSASLLSAIGLGDLVADTPEQFASIAAGLAQDRQRLGDLRRTMRQRMKSSPLCDGPAFARRFEAGLRQMWTTWAAANPA